MKVVQDGSTIRIILSRRNVLSLLSKLEMPNSARTLVKDSNGHSLIVEVEDDNIHYTDSLPGPMHPWTENWLKEHSK